MRIDFALISKSFFRKNNASKYVVTACVIDKTTGSASDHFPVVTTFSNPTAPNSADEMMKAAVAQRAERVRVPSKNNMRDPAESETWVNQIDLSDSLPDSPWEPTEDEVTIPDGLVDLQSIPLFSATEKVVHDLTKEQFRRAVKHINDNALKDPIPLAPSYGREPIRYKRPNGREPIRYTRPNGRLPYAVRDLMVVCSILVDDFQVVYQIRTRDRRSLIIVMPTWTP